MRPPVQTAGLIAESSPRRMSNVRRPSPSGRTCVPFGRASPAPPVLVQFISQVMVARSLYVPSPAEVPDSEGSPMVLSALMRHSPEAGYFTMSLVPGSSLRDTGLAVVVAWMFCRGR